MLDAENEFLLNEGTYLFNLKLKNEDDLVLAQKELNFNISGGTNTIPFDLEVISPVDGKGKVNIKFLWDETENVGTIKAGIFDLTDISTPKTSNGLNTLNVTEGSTNIVYQEAQIPTGKWIFKYEVYNKKATPELIFAASDIIEIKYGRTTSAELTLNSLNCYTAISYITGTGTFIEGFAPVNRREAHQQVTLPGPTKITAENGKVFAGWYENQDCSGSRVWLITEGDKQDKTLYAKYVDGAIVTEDNLADTLSSIPDSEYTIVISDLKPNTYNIKNKIKNIQNKKIILDLTECSELNQINNGITECTSLVGAKIGAKTTNLSSNPFYGSPNLQTLEVDPQNEKYDSRNNCNAIIEKSSNTIIAASNSTVIPSEIEKIGNNAFRGLKITELNLSGIKSIDVNAFMDCTELSGIELSEGLTEISSAAFKNCSTLTSFDIPQTLNKIGASAFYGCEALTQISIPSAVTEISLGAFYNCKNLTTVIIPQNSNITSIEEDAFCNCESLASIRIPDKCEVIGKAAFQNCRNMETVEISSSAALKNIGEKAFFEFDQEYSEGHQIAVNPKLKTIGNKDNPGEIVFPNSLESIENNAFYHNSALTGTIKLPEGTKSLDYEAFSKCSGLTKIELPASIESIGKSCFAYCSGLNTVTFAQNIKITKIIEGTFSFCSNISSLTIPDNITEIGASAFYGCELIPEFIIPETVTSIGNYAFNGCKAITQITIPKNVTNLGSGILDSCINLETIKFDYAVTSIPDFMFENCNKLVNFSCKQDSVEYNNLNFVTSVGKNAFSACNQLTDLSFLPNIIIIDDEAFKNSTGLTNIRILKTVSEIGNSAFYNCTSLASITFEDNSTLVSIGTNAFSIDNPSLNTQEIYIPESVCFIGKTAFSNRTNQTSVVNFATYTRWYKTEDETVAKTKDSTDSNVSSVNAESTTALNEDFSNASTGNNKNYYFRVKEQGGN